MSKNGNRRQGRSRFGAIDYTKLIEVPSDGRHTERLFEKRHENREVLLKAALVAAMNDKEHLARQLYFGRGVWWPELQPLDPRERTALLKEIMHMWGINEVHPEKRRN